MTFAAKTPAPLRQTVAFRLAADEYLELAAFFDKFPSGSEAMRWLLSQPEVRELMVSCRPDATPD